jgi:hypothetical protein
MFIIIVVILYGMLMTLFPRLFYYSMTKISSSLEQ